MRSFLLFSTLLSSCFILPFGGTQNQAECVNFDADGDGEDDLICETAECYELDINSDGSVDENDCGNQSGCVGIDEDMDLVVDRRDCGFPTSGGDCVIYGDIQYCGSFCGCAYIDWDDDGFVDDPNTICNLNAENCEQPVECNIDKNNDGNLDPSEQCADGYCLVADFDGDGTDDDTFCRNPSTACDSMDYNNDGTIDQETCNRDVERCLGLDIDDDGVVDLQDCDIDEDCHTYIPSFEFYDQVSATSGGPGFTDCRPFPNSDCYWIDTDGMGGVFGSDFIYCRDLCGDFGFDFNNDGIVDNGNISGDHPDCPPFDRDDCYLYDADGDSLADDHFCQDPTTLCYSIDLEADGDIEQSGCDNSSGECQSIDADQDGLSDDLFCQDPINDCYVLDLDQDGIIDDSNCGGEPGEECIGIDSNGDGSVDVFDCSNVNGCIGVDFDGNGVLDVFACDPNGN